MSIYSTAPLQVTPLQSAGLTLPANAAAWTPSAWVEFIASTGAAVTALAGISWNSYTSYSRWQFEIHIGIGPVGAETVLAKVRFHGPNSGNGGPSTIMFPTPIGGIPAGSRVSLRLASGVTVNTVDVCLLYFENTTSTNVTTAGLSCLPETADSIQVTPAGVAWANGPWTQITPGVGYAISLVGLAADGATSSADMEVDIGIGGAGAETVVTTFRSAAYARVSGRMWVEYLPAILPLPDGVRIAARLRLSTNSLNQVPVALLVYKTPVTPALTCGSVFPVPGYPDRYTLTYTGSALELVTAVTITSPSGAVTTVPPDSVTGSTVTWTFSYGVGGVWSVSVTDSTGRTSNTCTFTVSSYRPGCVVPLPAAMTTIRGS